MLFSQLNNIMTYLNDFVGVLNIMILKAFLEDTFEVTLRFFLVCIAINTNVLVIILLPVYMLLRLVLGLG